MADQDPNAPPGGDPNYQPGSSPDPNNSATWPAIYQQIAQLFKQASKGRYNPTLKDVSGWGQNIDAQYYETIANQILNVWGPQWIQDNPDTSTQTQTTTTTAPDGGGGAPGGGVTNPSYYTPFTEPQPAYVPFNQSVNVAPFTPPTLDQARSAPGYQFAEQQGEEALKRGAAAQGSVLSGGAQKDLIDYGQQAATTNYGNIFNQDLSAYYANLAPASMNFQAAQVNNQNLNSTLQGQWLNEMNRFYQNQNAPWSKYFQLAQLGSGLA